MKQILASTVLGLALGIAGSAEAGQTLDNVKSKGQLVCGVSTGTTTTTRRRPLNARPANGHIAWQPGKTSAHG